MPPIALLRYPDFVYAAWSAAQNRPLRQQMLSLSATGGGRICCPSEEGFILRAFSFDETRRGDLRSPVNSQQTKNGRTQFAPTIRRRLHRIVRNSLWLSLTRYATPPFPQKSRSARLFGCKRPLDGSLSLPTFADLYIAFSRELSFISDNLTAAASRRPTPWDIIYHSIRSLNFCGF